MALCLGGAQLHYHHDLLQPAFSFMFCERLKLPNTPPRTRTVWEEDELLNAYHQTHLHSDSSSPSEFPLRFEQ